jgi:hypothetical protein
MDLAPLRHFQSRLLVAVHGLDEPSLRLKEGEGRWSVLDVIAHLGDLELISAVRMRTILTMDDPALVAFAQEESIARLHGGDSRDEIIENFWFLRRLNLALLERLTEEQLERKGRHPNYGPVTVRNLAERITEHQERHLGQIERIKTARGLRASESPALEGVVRAPAAAAAIRDPGPGVRIRDLWRNGVRRAMQVEFDAGAQWPGLDYHVPGPEEVFIVSGDFDDGVATHHAGTFLHHPAGSSHSPRSQNGCVLFVYYPEG